MSDAYDRGVKVLSVLIVPALLAVACLAWSATRPPDVPFTFALTFPDLPAVEREPVTVVGPSTLTLFEVAKPKKPRTCGWYGMYASGEQRVWICS